MRALGTPGRDRHRAALTLANSQLASPSATIAVLRRFGLYTKKSYGQHLLIDDNVVGRILKLAGIEPTDVVLEVGPGIGTLTVALCRAARAVIAVEADSTLAPVLEATTFACPRPPITVFADAVSVPVSALVTAAGPPTLLVANLPYGVAATVVLRFMESIDSIRAATVMVQSEVADRMCAVVGTKAYGAYTVKLRLLAEPAGRFAVAAGSFLPPPRVESAVVRLERRAWPGAAAGDVRRAGALADAAFGQRRKTLRNSLAAALGAVPAAVVSVLTEAGIDPSARAETLPVETFVILGGAFHAAGLLGLRGH